MARRASGRPRRRLLARVAAQAAAARRPRAARDRAALLQAQARVRLPLARPDGRAPVFAKAPVCVAGVFWKGRVAFALRECLFWKKKLETRGSAVLFWKSHQHISKR